MATRKKAAAARASEDIFELIGRGENIREASALRSSA
jgi:hypothetical protein